MINSQTIHNFVAIYKYFPFSSTLELYLLKAIQFVRPAVICSYREQPQQDPWSLL